MKNSTKFGILLLILTTLASCSSIKTQKKEKVWLPRQQFGSVVWADDGSEVAIAEWKFEEVEQESTEGTPERRNFKYRILLQQIDGSGQRPITDWREHQSGQLFYMKQAGYLIVESLLEKGARRFDRIFLDGKEILIIETPDDEHQPCRNPAEATATTSPLVKIPYMVIPSPDGKQIANIYSPECGKITVEFLYANNLNLIESHSLDIQEPMNALWHPDGYLILTNNALNKAWKVSTLELPTSVTPPHCLFPKTTSSEMSLTGKLVYFDAEKKLTTRQVGRQEAFGCR
ncbi:MAG: hypothetical protein BWK79_08970 [Beggiatoa sp. IS2]|nr:MAG: hypothetical protein BWK79_08970 [Beggiatoa sp. IS2]